MRLGTKVIIALWALLVVVVGATIVNSVQAGYEYQRDVHSHIENAYWANTPELMLRELSLVEEGMKAQGLEPDMYGAYFWWNKIPSNRMDYQYAHIDSIQSRVQDVQRWRSQQASEGSTETTDIYELKMDNLRAFIQEDGWADDIASRTYWVNNHPVLYFWWTYTLGLFALVTGFTIGYAIWRGEYDHADTYRYVNGVRVPLNPNRW